MRVLRCSKIPRGAGRERTKKKHTSNIAIANASPSSDVSNSSTRRAQTHFNAVAIAEKVVFMHGRPDAENPRASMLCFSRIGVDILSAKACLVFGATARI